MILLYNFLIYMGHKNKEVHKRNNCLDIFYFPVS